jgi:hypothetical protein
MSSSEPKAPSILALTANCGLAGILDDEFTSMFTNSKGADIILISAQECHLQKTLDNFNNANRDGNYRLERSSLMSTFTKPKTGTGMVTLALVKTDSGCSVNFHEQEVLRRGLISGFNKGGLRCKLTVKKDSESFHLQHTNYHLDSDNKKARLEDLFNIYKHQFKTYKSFDELAAATPDLQIAAGDSNIRDRFVEGARKNVWSETSFLKCDELIRDLLLVEGGDAYSLTDTYKTSHDKNKEGKRKGLIDGGVLDRATIRNNGDFSTTSMSTSYQEAGFSDALREGQKRDHVILGEWTELKKADEFHRVKNSLCHRLQRLAPKLVNEIDELTESSDNKTTLLAIHNFFYGSPQGLVPHLIDPQGLQDYDAKTAVFRALQDASLTDCQSKPVVKNYLRAANRHVNGRNAEGYGKGILGTAAMVAACVFLIGFSIGTMGVGSLVGAFAIGLGLLAYRAYTSIRSHRVVQKIANAERITALADSSHSQSSRSSLSSSSASISRSLSSSSHEGAKKSHGKVFSPDSESDTDTAPHNHTAPNLNQEGNPAAKNRSSPSKSFN